MLKSSPQPIADPPASDVSLADEPTLDEPLSNEPILEEPLLKAGALSDSPSDERLPDRELGLNQWLDRRRLQIIIASSLLGLLILGAFGALYFAKAVFFPITLAVILKLIFGPVVRRLNRWRVPNFVGAGLVVGTIFGCIVAGVVFLSGPAVKWFDDAPQHFREAKYKLRSLKAPIKKVSDAGDQVADLTNVEGESKPLPVEVKQPGATSLLLNTTGEVVVAAFLTLVLLYFFLAGGDRFLEKVVSLTPLWRNKKNVVALARDIQQSMSSYLFATTFINAFLGIAIGIGMWVIGMPNPVLWGVMAACLNYIPYIGCIVGGCIVFLVALISFDSLGQAAWAPIIYFVLNSIEGYFVTPSVLGRSISLSPLAIVIGMSLWGWLWGVAGMLLAVPILAATKIACDHIPPLEPVGRLLGR